MVLARGAGDAQRFQQSEACACTHMSRCHRRTPVPRSRAFLTRFLELLEWPIKPNIKPNLGKRTLCRETGGLGAAWLRHRYNALRADTDMARDGIRAMVWLRDYGLKRGGFACRAGAAMRAISRLLKPISAPRPLDSKSGKSSNQTSFSMPITAAIGGHLIQHLANQGEIFGGCTSNSACWPQDGLDHFLP